MFKALGTWIFVDGCITFCHYSDKSIFEDLKLVNIPLVCMITGSFLFVFAVEGIFSLLLECKALLILVSLIVKNTQKKSTIFNG